MSDFSLMTAGEIEELSEKMAEEFNVNPDQMPLSRDEKSVMNDIFYAAIYEIVEKGKSETAVSKEVCYEIILSMAESLACRQIGKNRADFHKEVYETLKGRIDG